MNTLGSELYEAVLDYGYVAIFSILAFEGTGMPAPVQVVFLAAAFLIKKGKISFWKAVLTMALGNLLGNVLAYYAGRKKGKPFFDRYGKKIKLWREGFDRIKEWYRRYGGLVIVGSRLIGIPRTPAVWASGIIGIDFRVYVIYSFLGDFLWAAFYTFLMYKGLALLPMIGRLISQLRS
ncbi:DedA family protein [Thermosediminibacter oceani]|uniref:SNARE associated Golgi protein-related protein n=1 Tax=Thermosediminibacter oceani (strain ATCC BAA-1034 / DSM 16646 / JW/IW-1228P) TaxID=555079 RepID=D9RZ65_THEOJ|nr:DedA family protein [Thermosediminibacter oceani]ADL08619.1 SNARE associated Golgi protein-related protein [Thermosediminibacter oceani DSM 16646]